MKVVHCFSFLLVCHLCGPAVEGVGMAPWIPRLQNLELAKPPSPLTAEAESAVALAPAAVSESFRRLFLDVSNGSARASAYESECLSDFKKLMLTPGHNVFGAPKAFEAIDALGKPGSEILYGHLQMYGAFDECLNMYRLTHGFRRYTGNIPEVLISTARGRSPRAVLISTEGISLYTPKAMC